MKDILSKLLKSTALLILLGILAIIILLIIVLGKCTNSADSEIGIESTPNTILAIMPKNDLYIATAVIDDFTTLQQTEYHLGLFPENHSCVQILRQKVSYKINLSEIEFTQINEHTIEVRMPALAYIASTQASTFISDDEGYWKEALPSTNGLRNKVEQQIRTIFDTQENRQKALLYAKDAVTQILTQIGYQPIFVDTITPSSKD